MIIIQTVLNVLPSSVIQGHNEKMPMNEEERSHQTLNLPVP